jgi:hypothetical protein
MKYVIQYTLPYEHRVMVGIEAKSREAAITRANEMFEHSDIWDDTTEVPLLYNDFEETGDAGIPLEFTVEDEISGDWPEIDDSVKEIRRRDAAFQAAHLLVEAYRRGEACGGSIDWDDLDQAYQAALQTSETGVHRDPARPRRACARLAVVMEGGIVQAVIADQPDAAPSVAVIDYDTNGFETDELRYITQSDGTKSSALVVEHCVEVASIDLDEVFQPTE